MNDQQMAEAESLYERTSEAMVRRGLGGRPRWHTLQHRVQLAHAVALAGHRALYAAAAGNHRQKAEELVGARPAELQPWAHAAKVRLAEGALRRAAYEALTPVMAVLDGVKLYTDADPTARARRVVGHLRNVAALAEKRAGRQQARVAVLQAAVQRVREDTGWCPVCDTHHTEPTLECP